MHTEVSLSGSHGTTTAPSPEVHGPSPWSLPKYIGMFRYTKHYSHNILHYYCSVTAKIILHKTLKLCILTRNEFVTASSPQ
jgi:hypothetical protein